MNEQDYMRGQRQAWVSVLQQAVRALGYEATAEQSWIEEREATIAVLRTICEEYGDNEWPADLHLADVIEKHLMNHLKYVDGIYGRGDDNE